MSNTETRIPTGYFNVGVFLFESLDLEKHLNCLSEFPVTTSCGDTGSSRNGTSGDNSSRNANFCTATTRSQDCLLSKSLPFITETTASVLAIGSNSGNAAPLTLVTYSKCAYSDPSLTTEATLDVASERDTNSEMLDVECNAKMVVMAVQDFVMSKVWCRYSVSGTSFYF